MVIYNEKGEIVDITEHDLSKLITIETYGDDYYSRIAKGSNSGGGFQPSGAQLEKVDDGVHIRDYMDVDAIVRQSGIKPIKLGRRNDENQRGTARDTVCSGSQDQGRSPEAMGTDQVQDA